jgi:hypothetical protein
VSGNGLDSCGSGEKPVAGSGEHGDKTSGFQKRQEMS